MNQQTIIDLLTDQLRLKIGFSFPDFSAGAKHEGWARILIDRETWSLGEQAHGLSALAGDQLRFVESFLQTSRLFCELGRLPVFDLPRVRSLSHDSEEPGSCLLEIEIVLIRFLPQLAYQVPLNAALEICKWIAVSSPTSENRNKVFNTISEKVIEPLHRLVPAGKSTIPVLRVAHDLGIPFTHLGQGVYQLGWASKARRLDRSSSELDSAIGSKLAQNKVSTANILRAAGLPAPVHSLAISEKDALAIATRIGFPIVVKPADRDRGEGVTVDISNESQLQVAFAHAQKLSESRQVIIERQILGVCHRLFMANGRLLYAVKRDPISVVGDGKRTIRQLVDDEVCVQNAKPPWLRSEIKPIDTVTLATLQGLGFSSESIPARGERVPLRRIESTEWGGVDEEVTNAVHPENLRVAIQAARLFGLHMAGVDIISPDISRPWHANGAIINEVNFAPLLGGAEISRSHIPQFLADFIDGDGKIPIEFFDTEEAALRYQAQQLSLGRRCYVTSHSKTLNELGQPIPMPFAELKPRLYALTLSPGVDAIAVHTHSSAK